MVFDLKLTVQSDTRYLAPLRQLVSAVARLTGRKRFPKRAVTACTLALIEAVDNAIFHAHDRDERLPVTIEMSVGKGAITMVVVDKGSGMGRPAIHAPELQATKGRGLFMMDKLMDGVEMRRVKGGHAVILTLNT